MAMSFQHGLAAIAEAGSLHARHLQAAAQLVDDERGERLALDVLGHDQQRLPDCTTASSSGSMRLQAGQLLLVEQDVGSSSSTPSSRRW
jgi:hypothetical protein